MVLQILIFLIAVLAFDESIMVEGAAAKAVRSKMKCLIKEKTNDRSMDTVIH